MAKLQPAVPHSHSDQLRVQGPQDEEAGQREETGARQEAAMVYFCLCLAYNLASVVVLELILKLSASLDPVLTDTSSWNQE